MAFVSSLTEEHYNKKPGDLIKPSDWNTLVGEVIALGSAKLDRAGDSIQGALAVSGALSVAGAISTVGAGQPLDLRAGGLLVEDESGQLSFNVNGWDGATYVRGSLSVGGSEIVLRGGGGGAGNNNQAARALVDGGAQDGLILNYGNDFGKVTVAGDLVVQGQLRAAVANSNVMTHRMYPAEPIIYQDIFEALNRGAIAMLGNPKVEADWNTRHTASNPWGLRTLIQFGRQEEADGNGAVVEIPAGCETVWLRVLGERWNHIKAYFLDGAREECGVWAGGFRPHSICPDGAVPDTTGGGSSQHIHQWLAIPARRAGRLALIPKQGSGYFWLSGLAFSKNPWAHAAQSSCGYHMGFNGSEKVSYVGDYYVGDQAAAITGNRAIRVDSQTKLNPEWQQRYEEYKRAFSVFGDSMVRLQLGAAYPNLPETLTETVSTPYVTDSSTLQVPVIPNGRDKLLYIVTANAYAVDTTNTDMNVQHTAVLVNNEPVQRFMATYNNPFARYWNSRPGSGYIATRIPARLIPADSRYLKLQVDLSRQGDSMVFREAGTHDLETPLT